MAFCKISTERAGGRRVISVCVPFRASHHHPRLPPLDINQSVVTRQEGDTENRKNKKTGLRRDKGEGVPSVSPLRDLSKVEPSLPFPPPPFFFFPHKRFGNTGSPSLPSFVRIPLPPTGSKDYEHAHTHRHAHSDVSLLTSPLPQKDQRPKTPPSISDRDQKKKFLKNASKCRASIDLCSLAGFICER